MSLNRDLLLPVTTAGIMYPALNQLIVQIAMPNMVTRPFFQPYALTAGNAITFPKQSGSPGSVVDEIAEGAEIPLDVTAYSAVTVVPKKYGQAFVITRETIEDALVPIQQDQLSRISMRVANKIDKDCIDAIDSGRSGSVTASGKSLATDGTEFVMSGSGGPGIGQYDINDAIAQVENNNFIPDTLLIHPMAKRYISRLPHYQALMYYGDPLYQKGNIAVPGKFGEIQGLDAYASTNCPTGSAYILTRGRTSTILGQYAPLGFFVERRPITTAIQPLESRDSMGIYVTTRYGVTVLKGEAAAEITGINVS